MPSDKMQGLVRYVQKCIKDTRKNEKYKCKINENITSRNKHVTFARDKWE